MTKNRYSTTLNTRPFLYSETKRVAELIDRGIDSKNIVETVLDENLFQLASKDRAERFCSEIQKRLKMLDTHLFHYFINSDTQTSKAILFYALLKKDRLFYEWMREVVWDKFLIMDWIYQKRETESFIARKSEQDDTVKRWAKKTKIVLVRSYHNLIEDVWMASSTGEELYLQPLIINPEVRTYLINHKEKGIVEVMLGEVIQ